MYIYIYVRQPFCLYTGLQGKRRCYHSSAVGFDGAAQEMKADSPEAIESLKEGADGSSCFLAGC